MKRLLFLLAIFCTFQANAQPYSISFSGTDLSTVKVENLTTGVVVDVPAGDVLLLSTTTGIPEVNKKSSRMKIYPNPMIDKSTLEILPPVAGDAIISVCDMTGKVLTQFKCYLENFMQEFSLSGIKNGLHVINVQGNGYQFSEKLLSNGKSNGTASIVKISNNIQAVAEKKSIIMDSKGIQANVDMVYTAGERLKYTAVSGNNKTVMTDIPTANKTVTFTFTECKDGDNNYYPVVQINTQLWMAENLKTTKLKDGTTLIPNVIEDDSWGALTTPGYCWYGNNLANKDVYGALYNWYTVITGNLCPTGWHVPRDTEWTTLENYLIANGYNYDGTVTDNKIAKSLASTTMWTSSTTLGAVGNTDFPAKRNATGFTALPGGYRANNGAFGYIGLTSPRWSATEYDASNAWYRDLGYHISNEVSGNYGKKGGFSMRCLNGVYIGDSYQGGKVAYILQPEDAGYDVNVQHGLIAAPDDQSFTATWGCAGTLISGADGTAIGTGNQNTIDIMAGCSTAGIAARLCGDLVLGVYDDWYLPSQDELNKLYINKVAIGGFQPAVYWSSTELEIDYAAAQYFNNGAQATSFKGNTTYCVRAVRAF